MPLFAQCERRGIFSAASLRARVVPRRYPALSAHPSNVVCDVGRVGACYILQLPVFRQKA